MLEIFRFVFEVNFLIFPISAGWLSYRKIKGKPGGRPLRMMITSFIMMLLAWTGVLLNESPEVRADFVHSVKSYFSVDE
ncbi:MAG: hypothetical protein IJT73_08715 [Selenomonadaceae bacterium]|nr:hypothetical protein [Selenomonadaceae bacterium]